MEREVVRAVAHVYEDCDSRDPNCVNELRSVPGQRGVYAQVYRILAHFCIRLESVYPFGNDVYFDYQIVTLIKENNKT